MCEWCTHLPTSTSGQTWRGQRTAQPCSRGAPSPRAGWPPRRDIYSGREGGLSLATTSSICGSTQCNSVWKYQRALLLGRPADACARRSLGWGSTVPGTPWGGGALSPCRCTVTGAHLGRREHSVQCLQWVSLQPGEMDPLPSKQARGSVHTGSLRSLQPTGSEKAAGPDIRPPGQCFGGLEGWGLAADTGTNGLEQRAGVQGQDLKFRG